MNYSTYNDPAKPRILDTYNGRVNILEPPDATVQFKMMERIAIKNKATEFRNPLEGVWETNTLARVFFSAENVQILQNGLRAGVYRLSQGKYVIPPQNQDALKIIMRSTFLQYAKNAPDHIPEQVETLNNLVWDYAIPFVYNEAVSYVRYLEDQSTLVVPLDREVRPDREYKQLSTNPFI
jgi:Family of unknown function (DUF5761)|uniref:Minor capsid protein P8 central region domain-containing protein n=1 Tax=viral metagenome TaxID=1070528 RepID=A0A6C0EMN9_9ZZZZ